MEAKDNTKELLKQGVFVFEDKPISDDPTKYIEVFLKDLKND